MEYTAQWIGLRSLLDSVELGCRQFTALPGNGDSIISGFIEADAPEQYAVSFSWMLRYLSDVDMW